MKTVLKLSCSLLFPCLFGCSFGLKDSIEYGDWKIDVLYTVEYHPRIITVRDAQKDTLPSFRIVTKARHKRYWIVDNDLLWLKFEGNQYIVVAHKYKEFSMPVPADNIYDDVVSKRSRTYNHTQAESRINEVIDAQERLTVYLINVRPDRLDEFRKVFHKAEIIESVVWSNNTR